MDCSAVAALAELLGATDEIAIRNFAEEFALCAGVRVVDLLFRLRPLTDAQRLLAIREDPSSGTPVGTVVVLNFLEVLKERVPN